MSKRWLEMPAFDITSDPSLHDISRGTTGCGDDDDDEWFDNASDSLTAVADAFTIEREHGTMPDATAPWNMARRFCAATPGSTGHIYCG
jgi:hypothetical protein